MAERRLTPLAVEGKGKGTGSLKLDQQQMPSPDSRRLRGLPGTIVIQVWHTLWHGLVAAFYHVVPSDFAVVADAASRLPVNLGGFGTKRSRSTSPDPRRTMQGQGCTLGGPHGFLSSVWISVLAFA